MKKCVYCDKNLITNEPGIYFCNAECWSKLNILGEIETMSDGEVICPYCGREHTEDLSEWYEADEDTFICASCDKAFLLTAEPTVTFISTPTHAFVVTFISTPTHAFVELIYEERKSKKENEKCKKVI